MSTLPEELINEKVLRYEEFINDVLKEDLKKIHFQWEHKTSEMSEWIQLKTMIQSFQDLEMKSFKSKMDIGSNIFAQVVVPSTEKIIINVGAGIYVEYNHAEAFQLIEFKVKSLEQELDLIKNQSYTIKARIKLVLNGIHELQGIK